jgi:hypothetical protein
VICPHCYANLLRRQRRRHKCRYCRREFAFDPKTNAIRLHDLKVRRLAKKLRARGLSYTPTQLRYAASRKMINEPAKPLQGCGCLVFLAAPFATAVAVILISVRPPGGDDGGGGIVFGTLGGALGLAVVLNVIFAMLRPVMARRRSIKPPISDTKFQTLLRRWVRIYDKPPPGMVAEQPPAFIPNPRFALVCPDPSVLSCLSANGVAGRNAMVLVPNVAAVPPSVPVILVHDASPAGLRFVAAARAALPGRTVVDAGLRPATVLRRSGLLRLRDRTAELPALPITDEEARWLAEGWWSPVAALPPAKLIVMVERALARVDPDRAWAASVGFLTWPG